MSGPPSGEPRRVTVAVTFTGDLAPLQAAGLATGYDAGGEVTGRIALRDLNALAALESVTRIEMQPRCYPHRDEAPP